MIRKYGVESAIREIMPGARAEFFRHAAHHTIYLIIHKRKKYVFRYPNDPAEVDIGYEFSLLKQLPKGMVPEPIHIDTTCRSFPIPYMIISHIEGKRVLNWTDRQLRLHAKTLASLHKKKYPYCTYKRERYRSLDMQKILKRHVKVYCEKYPGFNKVLQDRDVQQVLPKMERYLENHHRLFDALKKFPIAHYDLNNSNMLFTNDSVVYLDWEYGEKGDPAYDLAHLFYPEGPELPDKIDLRGRERILFGEYTRKTGDKTVWDRAMVWQAFFLFDRLLICTLHIQQGKKGYSAYRGKVLRMLKSRFDNPSIQRSKTT
jgi:thiamine kinase-like enzyme